MIVHGRECHGLNKAGLANAPSSEHGDQSVLAKPPAKRVDVGRTAQQQVDLCGHIGAGSGLAWDLGRRRCCGLGGDDPGGRPVTICVCCLLLEIGIRDSNKAIAAPRDRGDRLGTDDLAQ
jgi:hypothetical protein